MDEQVASMGIRFRRRYDLVRSWVGGELTNFFQVTMNLEAGTAGTDGTLHGM